MKPTAAQTKAIAAKLAEILTMKPIEIATALMRTVSRNKRMAFACVIESLEMDVHGNVSWRTYVDKESGKRVPMTSLSYNTSVVEAIRSIRELKQGWLPMYVGTMTNSTTPRAVLTLVGDEKRAGLKGAEAAREKKRVQAFAVKHGVWVRGAAKDEQPGETGREADPSDIYTHAVDA